jgi:hypothetical protein
MKPPPLTSESKNYAEIFNIVPTKIDQDEPFGLAVFILVCSGKSIEYPFPQAVYNRTPGVLAESHVLRYVFDFKVDGIKQEAKKATSRKFSFG